MKTEVMVVSKVNVPRCKIKIGEKVKQEDKFDYLGSAVQLNGRWDKINKNDKFKKESMEQWNELYQIAARTMRTYVWLTFLYDCETWAITRPLEESEMWLWRGLLRVTWTKKANEKITLEIMEAQ